MIGKSIPVYWYCARCGQRFEFGKEDPFVPCEGAETPWAGKMLCDPCADQAYEEWLQDQIEAYENDKAEMQAERMRYKGGE